MNNLERYLPEIEAYLQSAIGGTDIVSEAMRYSLSGGGKRVRPCLVLEFCRLCGGDFHKAVPFAAAVEMIHTYSLIHDDLPCMDDDNLRRGKPACHIQFGYANALLAGDGLLTLAFETLAKAELSSEQIVAATVCLAQSAGHLGMIGGQTMDLENEKKTVPIERLRQTDTLKTVQLIRAACVLGCIAADADREQISAAEAYAYGLGLAFQIVDDILDETGTTATLGKPVGSDKIQQKNTYVSLLGLERARAQAKVFTDSAVDALQPFGADGQVLCDYATLLCTRKN